MTIMNNFQLDQVQSWRESADLSFPVGYGTCPAVVVLNWETFLTMSAHYQSGQSCADQSSTNMTKKK